MKTETPLPFFPGQRVKPSEYSLRSDRDSWLRAGSSHLKSSMQASYQHRAATRGTVTACERGKYGINVTVTTDAGAVHNSLPDLWEAIA